MELPPRTAAFRIGEEERFGFANVSRLTEALRAGDAGAFRFLHGEWNERIQRYCFALAAGDDAFAIEIAQATYLRIFKSVPRLGDEAALWKWIACAMRSAAIDLRRVGGRYRRALARFADWLRFGTVRDAGGAEDSRLLAALDDALAALAEDEREIVNRRYYAHESLETIAAHFATTARAIEGRLARIRAKLRNTMTSTLRKDEA